jgi:hypothetical protein
MKALESKELPWVEAMPSQFNFYHLGQVQLSENEIGFQDLQVRGVGFQVFGDVSVFLMILFASDLDFSIYAELGNVIASQLASQLSRMKNIEVMISSPQDLSNLMLKRLRNIEPIFRMSYGHCYNNQVIPVEAWIVPSMSEGIGNA